MYNILGMTALQLRQINESLVFNKFNNSNNNNNINKPNISWNEKLFLSFQVGMSINQCQICSRDVKVVYIVVVVVVVVVVITVF